jgi:glutamyl-tRNA synthetase
MLAKSMGGRCFLRIEDTDQKREVEGAAEKLIAELNQFGFRFDGEPVYQSKRADIYKKYADKLIAEGKAYEDEGAVRFRAPEKTEIRWHDLVKGEMRLPSLERDPVILKSNGLPPYNFAHVIDDTLMGVTHVVRGEEWLPSTAEHIQLRAAVFGDAPAWQYAHLPVICIMEDGNKRKLSKRKDKEALVEHFLTAGYPIEALIEYLLTIYNTDFEMWRTANPRSHWTQFHFRFEKIGSNSPLFDWGKLNNISQNYLANLGQEEIEKRAKEFLGDRVTREQFKNVCTLLAIDRGTERPRKDIAKFGDILTEFDYLFKPVKMTPLLEKYQHLMKSVKDRDEWFNQCKTRAAEFGFKNVRDFTQAIRVALTGRERSTDLYTISVLLL